MTHDELLAKLNGVDETTWTRTIPVFNALRAVVELHKPIEGFENFCDVCSFADAFSTYPCKTIKAIEKELG